MRLKINILHELKTKP